MSAFPPVISDDKGKPIPIGGQGDKLFGRSVDPAKYVVARSRFYRPKLRIPVKPPAKGPEFEWPNGIEGMRVSGQVGNARHKYIGDNAEKVQVMHRDSRTIELSGQFSGSTGSQNVHELLDVITAVSPTGFWLLYLPPSDKNSLVFMEQQVNIENYDFSHSADDRMDSWDYTITFIRVGISHAKPPKLKPIVNSPTNPVGTKAPKGTGGRIFTVHAGGRTLRAAAQLVYQNPDRWSEIYKKNQKALDALNIPTHILPTKLLPLGMKLHY